LATRAGKLELSCLLGTTRRALQEKFSQKPYNKSFIDQPCSARWPDIGLAFFCELMDLDRVSVYKNAKKTDLANIQPS